MVFDAADAHADDGIAELGVVGGDDEVAGPAEHETAGDGLAVDGGDGGLGDVTPALAQAEVELRLPPVAVGGALPVLGVVGAPPLGLLAANVVAGGEVRSVGLEDDDLDLFVLLAHAPGLVELFEKALVLRVSRFGPVQRNDADVVVLFRR